MPRARELRLALAWIDRKRSAPRELAIAVRSSSGMKTSVAAGQDDVGPELLPDEPLEPQRDVEDQVLLLEAAAADRAGVVAAVAGVDDDAAGAEAELAGEAVAMPARLAAGGSGAGGGQGRRSGGGLAVRAPARAG